MTPRPAEALIWLLLDPFWVYWTFRLSQQDGSLAAPLQLVYRSLQVSLAIGFTGLLKPTGWLLLSWLDSTGPAKLSRWLLWKQLHSPRPAKPTRLLPLFRLCSTGPSESVRCLLSPGLFVLKDKPGHGLGAHAYHPEIRANLWSKFTDIQGLGCSEVCYLADLKVEF